MLTSDDALDHVVRHRRQRRVDQPRAVVERHDAHARRQDLVVDARDRLVHGRAAPPSGSPRGAAARSPRPSRSRRRARPPRAAACTPRPPARRCAPAPASRSVALTTVLPMSVGELQVAAAAHDQLGLAELQIAARRRAVRRRDRVDHVLQRDARVAQPARVGEHVLLLLEAAEADHVRDARRAHQVLRDDPVLPAAQLAGEWRSLSSVYW